MDTLAVVEGSDKPLIDTCIHNAYTPASSVEPVTVLLRELFPASLNTFTVIEYLFPSSSPVIS